MDIIAKIEQERVKSEITDFSIGDTVNVHTKIIEGDRERIQIFTGTVISRSGNRNNESFTVRRVVYGEGVERVFLIHSPRIDKIEVVRKGKVRRAKLYYLKGKVGKKAKVKELKK